MSLIIAYFALGNSFDVGGILPTEIGGVKWGDKFTCKVYLLRYTEEMKKNTHKEFNIEEWRTEIREYLEKSGRPFRIEMDKRIKDIHEKNIKDVEAFLQMCKYGRNLPKEKNIIKIDHDSNTKK